MYGQINTKRRSRCMLHKDKLREFERWLVGQGYKPQALKDYEVLRMTHPRHKTVIVWAKLDATTHYTTQGESGIKLAEWLEQRKGKDR